MSTVKDKDPEVLEHFLMPKPLVGDIVWWFVDANTTVHPRPCIVVEVGLNTLKLVDLAPGTCGTSRRGVRHVNDPILSRALEAKGNGGWDFRRRETPPQFSGDLAALTDRVEWLEARATAADKAARKG
jgi:hypothetical protein